MKKLKLFYIYNKLEVGTGLIFNSNSEKEYIERVSLIAKENGDEKIALNSYEDCDGYILDYCDNLDLEPNEI